MTHAIKDKIAKCPQCLELRPSKPSEPLIQTLDVTLPFEAVSVHIGYLRGDYYLVLVDRYSGWPEILRLTKLETGVITKVLEI